MFFTQELQCPNSLKVVFHKLVDSYTTKMGTNTVLSGHRAVLQLDDDKGLEEAKAFFLQCCVERIFPCFCKANDASTQFSVKLFSQIPQMHSCTR